MAGRGPVTARIYPVGAPDDELVEQVAAALRTSGIHQPPAPHPPRDEAGPVVLVFDTFSSELAEAVRRAAAGGRQRVLTVAASQEGLPDGRAWELLRLGASDVLPWDGPQTAAAMAARLERWAQIDELTDSPLVRGRLVGQSQTWRGTLREVVEVGRFTSSSVLLTGESGTGKELVARLVHDLDQRPDKGRFVVLDCTTVVPTLSGSEFFGHERGAFTGAVSARDGAFALADGGTLFLDEVGELPQPLQAELLRVVQEGTYKRIGSNVWQTTRFRLICATNRDLADEQTRGTFRRDFYHRIAAAVVELPPLRERPEDILALFTHFLGQLGHGQAPPELDPVVREVLWRRSYPGNVRDLRQLAVRIGNRHVGPGPITAGDLPERERPEAGDPGTTWSEGELERPVRRALALGVGLKELREATADVAVRVAVEEAGGSLRQAASRLRVTDRALQLRRANRQQGPSDLVSGLVSGQVPGRLEEGDQDEAPARERQTPG
jgi:transcriptional regulator with GAF, ATPase, and Fis domain